MFDMIMALASVLLIVLSLFGLMRLCDLPIVRARGSARPSRLSPEYRAGPVIRRTYRLFTPMRHGDMVYV